MAKNFYGYANAAYDSAAKRVLSKKGILAWILQRVVPEFQDVSIEDIAQKYIENEPVISAVPTDQDTMPNITGARNEDNSPTEGLVTFDILFHATAPQSGDSIELIINIEAQKSHKVGYSLLKRAEYYASRLISAQKNTEFTHSNYDGIKKVYSIWIVMSSADNNSDINSYKMTEEHLLGDYVADPAEYQLMNIVMIYLGNRRSEDKLISLLRLLFKDEIAAAEKKKRLEQEYNLKMVHTDEKEMREMCNLSEGIYERGMERGMKFGREQGRAEGIELGMERGREQGIGQGTLNAYREMLDKGYVTMEQLRQDSSLSSEQLAMLEK